MYTYTVSIQYTKHVFIHTEMYVCIFVLKKKKGRFLEGVNAVVLPCMGIDNYIAFYPL